MEKTANILQVIEISKHPHCKCVTHCNYHSHIHAHMLNVIHSVRLQRCRCNQQRESMASKNIKIQFVAKLEIIRKLKKARYKTLNKTMIHK